MEIKTEINKQCINILFVNNKQQDEKEKCFPKNSFISFNFLIFFIQMILN